MPDNYLIIYYIVIVQALFTAFVFISKKNKPKSSSLLTSLILLIISDVGVSLIKAQYSSTMGDIFTLDCFIFAYFPLILLYLRATLLKIKTLSVVNILHFIPFLFFLCLSLVLKEKTAIFRNQLFIESETTSKLVYIIFYSLAYLSVIVYTISSLACISYARKNIEDLYSYELAEKLLYWFKYLTILFFVTYMLQAITGFTSIIMGNNTFDTNIFPVVGQCLFCFSLLYFIINRPEIFFEERNKLKEINSGILDSYTKSRIPKETLDLCSQKLLKLMETDKVYLQNDLSLQDVAEKINFPKHYITQSLNINLKKNFYLFVNEYRVKEFKARVTDKKNDNLTIMSIAYDSGFNSKSTFNSIFKKFTGETPSEYVEARKTV